MDKYFYIDNQGVQKGPFELSSLRNEPIGRHTYVWTEGMSEWKPASEVRALDFLFSNKPPSVDPYFKPTNAVPDVPMHDSWLTKSILVTLLPFILCGSTFSLLGIIAIINSSKVESLYLAGNIKESIEASNKARRWTNITFWVSIGWIIVLILIIIFVVAFAGFSSISEAVLSA